MPRDLAPNEQARPVRLFVAIDMPPAVKSVVASFVEPYRDRIPGARWTRSDGWHLTLKFLGATWPRLMETVRAEVTRVASSVAPFPSSLTEVGVFPSNRRARVLWVGLSDPDGRMTNLAAALDAGLGEHFDTEGRAFTPHVTLARLVPPRDLDEFVPGLTGTPVPSESFEVDRLVLYRSHLSPRGATYEPIFAAPLGG
jgi:RNA 2',3'-cyclic 3'-phosphodiesterase